MLNLIIAIIAAQKDHDLSKYKLDLIALEVLGRLLKEQGKGSTGTSGKAFEIAVRRLLYKCGLAEEDYRARSSKVDDFRIVVNGKAYRGEIKTGDGIVANTGAEDLTEDDVLPGKALIVYCTEPEKLNSIDDLLDNTVVVSREEFLDTVLTAGQKRHPNWRSGLKPATNNLALRAENKIRKANGEKPLRDCYTMQPTYRKARWELCQSGELTTLRTFLEEIGRL